MRRQRDIVEEHRVSHAVVGHHPDGGLGAVTGKVLGEGRPLHRHRDHVVAHRYRDGEPRADGGHDGGKTAPGDEGRRHPALQVTGRVAVLHVTDADDRHNSVLRVARSRHTVFDLISEHTLISGPLIRSKFKKKDNIKKNNCFFGKKIC